MSHKMSRPFIVKVSVLGYFPLIITVKMYNIYYVIMFNIINILKYDYYINKFQYHI